MGFWWNVVERWGHTGLFTLSGSSEDFGHEREAFSVMELKQGSIFKEGREGDSAKAWWFKT